MIYNGHQPPVGYGIGLAAWAFTEVRFSQICINLRNTVVAQLTALVNTFFVSYHAYHQNLLLPLYIRYITIIQSSKFVNVHNVGLHQIMEVVS